MERHFRTKHPPPENSTRTCRAFRGNRAAAAAKTTLNLREPWKLDPRRPLFFCIRVLIRPDAGSERLDITKQEFAFLSKAGQAWIFGATALSRCSGLGSS